MHSCDVGWQRDWTAVLWTWEPLSTCSVLALDECRAPSWGDSPRPRRAGEASHWRGTGQGLPLQPALPHPRAERGKAAWPEPGSTLDARNEISIEDELRA